MVKFSGNYFCCHVSSNYKPLIMGDTLPASNEFSSEINSQPSEDIPSPGQEIQPLDSGNLANLISDLNTEIGESLLDSNVCDGALDSEITSILEDAVREIELQDSQAKDVSPFELKYAVVRSGGKFYVVEHGNLQQALFSCSQNQFQFNIGDRVSNESSKKEFVFGVVKAIDLTFEKAKQKRNDLELEKEKHEEREKRIYRTLGERTVIGPSYRQKVKKHKVAFALGTKYTTPKPCLNNNKLRPGYTTPKKVGKYSWLGKPSKDIWQFHVEFQNENSVEDRRILNQYLEITQHLAPVTVNGKNMAMIKGDWVSLYYKLESMKILVEKKIPENWLPKTPEKFLATNDGSCSVEISSAPNNQNSQDVISNAAVSDKDVIDFEIENSTVSTEHSIAPSFAEPSTSSSFVPLPLAIPKPIPVPSFGKSRAWQAMMKAREDCPDWDSEDEDQTEKQLDEVEEKTNKKSSKKKKVKKNHWEPFLNIPSYTKEKLHKSDTDIDIDNYFQINLDGLIKALKLVIGGDGTNYNQIDVAKTVLTIHPVFNTDIFNKYDPRKSDDEHKMMFDYAKDYIREAVINFVKNLPNVIKTGGKLQITVDERLEDDPSFFRNNTRRHYWKTGKKNNVAKQFNQVKSFIKRKLPRIVEEEFSKGKPLQYWITPFNEDWSAC